MGSRYNFSEATLQHSPGLIHLCQNKAVNGTRKIFSCGNDEKINQIRLTDYGEVEAEMKSSQNTNQSAIAVYENDVYVGCTTTDALTRNDEQAVIKYSLDQFLASPPVLTFSLEVTCIDISNDGNYLVAGSSDFVLKIKNLSDDSFYDRYETDGEVVSVSIDPMNRWICVSTTSGNVDIRRLKGETGDYLEIPLPPKAFKTQASFNRISKENPRMQCCWSPDGNLLYLPAMGGIFVVDTVKWEKTKSLNSENLEKDVIFSVACLTESGDFLAAYAINRSIVLWDTKESRQINIIHCSTVISKAVITSLLFYPDKDGTLIVADSGGYIRALNAATIDVALDQLEGQLDDDKLWSTDVGVNEEIDDNDGDLAAIKSQYGYRDAMHERERQIDIDQILRTHSRDMIERRSMICPHGFVSGSTPLAEGNQFLKWNSFGVIRRFIDEVENTDSIEIEFHDANVHAEIVEDNMNFNYSMGDLNNELVALASKTNEKDESQLYVIHISAWDHNSQNWRYTMPTGERIENLCVGISFVAIYTDRRYVRIFTLTGIQRAVLSTAGPVLTMVGYGESFAIVRAPGCVLITENEKGYEHQYEADIYNVTLKAVRPINSRLGLALSPSCKLDWIAFSGEGNLVTMDHNFCIRLFSPLGVWTPILEGDTLLRHREEDGIFPIAIREFPEPQFRYIYCKSSRYPKLTKKTAPQIDTWKLPLLNLDSDKTKLEHELLLSEMLQTTNDLSTSLANGLNPASLIQKHTASLIKYFALSIKSGREVRAAESANLATSSSCIQKMCNYASKQNRNQLVEKITQIGRKLLNQETSESTLQEAPSNFDLLVPRRVQLKRKPEITTAYSVVGSNNMEMDSQSSVRQSIENDTLEYKDLDLSANTSLNDSAFNIPHPIDDRFSANPFKRAKVQDSMANKDFFEQLSTTTTKSAVISKNTKISEKPSKKQAILSFGGSNRTQSDYYDSSRNVLESVDMNQRTEIQKSGFVLWREENYESLMASFSGTQDEFSKYAVKQFRKLARDEQQKYHEMAKSSQL